jgi:2-dehydropantoate 2-reductase
MAGNEVRFIDAAPATIDTLNAEGITMTAAGAARHTPATAGTATDFNEALELIIVFTKSFHTEAAVASIKHLIGDATFGLTLQNGLGNADALLAPSEQSVPWSASPTSLPTWNTRPHLHGRGRQGPHGHVHRPAGDFPAGPRRHTERGRTHG